MTYEDWIAAITEDPADDVRRLACADWFEEQGDQRHGEFIRVSIQTGIIGSVAGRHDSTGWFRGVGDWLRHGAIIIKMQPISKIVFSDKQPTEFSDCPAVWERDMSDVLDVAASYITMQDSHVYGAVFDLMEGEDGGMYFVIGKVSDKRYPSTQHALDALSSASLVWARDESRRLQEQP